MASRAPFDFTQKHLLLVAGASGSGKSTFINALLYGSLDSEIRAALPHDVKNWIHAFGRQRASYLGRRRPARKPPGQILHHEITESFRSEHLADVRRKPSRLYRLEENPQLLMYIAATEKLLMYIAATEKLYLAIVRPPRQTLIRQLAERTAVYHLPHIVRSKAIRFAPQIRRMEDALPSWMAANAAKVLGRTWATRALTRSASDELCKLYAEPDAVETIYRHWESSLFSLCGEKLAAPVLYVEPVGEQGGTKSFRLTEPTPRLTERAAAAPKLHHSLLAAAV